MYSLLLSSEGISAPPITTIAVSVIITLFETKLLILWLWDSAPSVFISGKLATNLHYCYLLLVLVKWILLLVLTFLLTVSFIFTPKILPESMLQFHLVFGYFQNAQMLLLFLDLFWSSIKSFIISEVFVYGVPCTNISSTILSL